MRKRTDGRVFAEIEKRNSIDLDEMKQLGESHAGDPVRKQTGVRDFAESEFIDLSEMRKYLELE